MRSAARSSTVRPLWPVAPRPAPGYRVLGHGIVGLKAVTRLGVAVATADAPQAESGAPLPLPLRLGPAEARR
jgi:hypothetical protein